MTIAEYLQKRLGRMRSPVEVELTHAANRVNYNQVQKSFCPQLSPKYNSKAQSYRPNKHRQFVSLSLPVPVVYCTSNSVPFAIECIKRFFSPRRHKDLERVRG